MKANPLIGIMLPALSAILIFLYGCESEISFANQAPSGLSITVGKCNIWAGGEMRLSGEAVDNDGDPLRFIWRADAGTFDPTSGEGRNIDWTAPVTTGVVRVTLIVTDGIDERSKGIDISVGEKFPDEIISTEIVEDSGYPYILANPAPLEVPPGCTLRIGPGVRVIVDSGAGGLMVLGKLFIDGTADREVSFEPNVCPGETGSWGGISFEGMSAEGNIGHLVAYAAKDCIKANNRANITLDTCTISANAGVGVGVYAGSRAVINGCDIMENSYGLDVRHSWATVTDTDIRDNSSGGVYLDDSVTTRPVSLEGCTIANNSADGIFISYKASPVINGCSIFSNSLYAVRLFLYVPGDSIKAEDSFWGMGYDTAEEIQERIWDRKDEPQNSNAYVDFDPWCNEDPNF